MPLRLSDDDAPLAEPNVALKLPCGCVNHEAVRLRVPGALSQHIDDPCLRKVVEADLDAEEPKFPLCPDPTCDHHRATRADGFRSGWAWESDYLLLTTRLRKEAIRRVRTEKLADDASRRGGARVPSTRASPRHDDDFRARIAVERARGDSWSTIAERHGVTRQAAEKWGKWEEVRKAEKLRPKRRGLRRPARLGDRGADIADE